MKKVLNWFLDILKGFGIGVSCIIPGVSGGTFALLTNCYDKIVFSIANIFKNFLRSILVLLPLAIGGGFGILFGYLTISRAFTYILFSIIALFAGLILGSIPSLFGEIKTEDRSNLHILLLILSMLFVVAIGAISFIISIEYPHYSVEVLFESPKWYAYLLMIPVGAVSAFALVAPGISGSMIMLVLGFYEPILERIKHILTFDHFLVNFGLMCCFGVGVLIGVALMTKFMKYMLLKHRTLTYSIIIGLVMGSLIAIFLNKDIYFGDDTYAGLLANPKELLLGIPLFVLGAVGSFFAIHFSKKREITTNEEQAA